METLASISEATLRFSIFAAVFVIMAALELAIPKRELGHSKAHRWFTNIVTTFRSTGHIF